MDTQSSQTTNMTWSARVTEVGDKLADAVEETFHTELKTIPWFTREFIEGIVDSFVNEFEV